MQQDKNNIENQLKQLENKQLPDLSNMDEHWQEMNVLLNHTVTLPPRKRFWKKVTRRTITYMGVAAVVITTSYYAIKISGKNKTNKKIVPAVVLKRNDNDSLQKTAILRQSALVTKPVFANTIPKIKIKPVLHYTQSNRVLTKIKEKSDTVFLQPSVPPVPVNTQAAGQAVEIFYSRLKKPAQQFEIDPAKDTVLFGKQGTILKILANTFVYPDRKPVNVPVHVTLIECYEYADMLAHRLYSLSDNKQLVTGGMINIKAQDKHNNNLKLVSYRPIQLTMPAEKFDPDMQLFLDDASRVPPSKTRDSLQVLSGFSDGTVVNWRAAGQPQGYDNKEKFIHPNKIKLFDVRQSVNRINQKDENIFQVMPDKNISDDKIKQLISNKYNTDVTKLKLKRVENFGAEVKAKNTNVMITKDGFVASDSVMISFDRAVKEGYVSRGDSLAYMIQIKADSLLYVERRRKDSLTFIRQQEFNRTYNFNITGLGWINCDKFYKTDKPTIEFSINVDEDLQQAIGNYTLIFSNLKSIIKGRYQNGQIYFGKLPEGEPVQLVCVVAQNNKALACVQSLKISPQAMAALKFEEITAEAFHQKVEKL